MMECCATFQKCFVVCEKDPNTLLNRKAAARGWEEGEQGIKFQFCRVKRP